MAEYGGINYPEDMPSHVAVIMDGNGRWAKRRGMPRTFGHKAGVEACLLYTSCIMAEKECPKCSPNR